MAVTTIAKPTGPCSVQVVSPNGGESLVRGQATTIMWAGDAPGGLVDLLLFKGRNRVRRIGMQVPNTGNLVWTVPAGLPVGSNYRIKIRASADRTCRDVSDARFSIVNGS